MGDEIEKLRSYIVANQESLAPKYEGLIFGVGVVTMMLIDSLVGRLSFTSYRLLISQRENIISSRLYSTIRYKSNHGNTGPNSIRGSSTVIRGQNECFLL